MEITAELSSYSPRACDCDFCHKHKAAYLSDRNGKLKIYVKNEVDLSKYQQGNRIANFLICKKCGVLVGVYSEKEGRLYAAVNSNAVDGRTNFGQETVVSPKKLSANEKIQRWQDNWFSDVKIKPY